MFKYILTFVLTLVLYSCQNFSGKEQKNHYLLSFGIDKEIYNMTDWSSAPQFAIWLENDSTGEVQTIFVTQKTAQDNWEGKSACPISLPFWVSKYKKEYRKDKGPTFFDPLPDAFTGETPKESFSIKFGIDNKPWSLFLEVNVSGDYNGTYKRTFPETWMEDFGNGQPSIVYQFKSVNDLRGNFKIVGQTDQVSPVNFYSDTTGITSAHLLLKNFELDRIN